MCATFTAKNRTEKQKELGFYPCPKASKHTVHIHPLREHNCEKFREVPADQAQARIDWERGLAE